GLQEQRRCGVLDTQGGLAKPISHTATIMPRLSQVWIEHKRSIDQGNASISLVNNVGERKPARAERDSVVPTQTHSLASQSRGFSDLIRTIAHPVIVLALNVTQCGGGISQSKLWIEFDRPVEQAQCLARALPGPLINLGYPV